MNGGEAARKAGFVLFVLILIPFVVFAVPQVVGASQSYVVLSSSMAPTINAGDVVIVEDVPPAAIEEGDIITFRPSGGGFGSAERVTHRVVEVVQREDGTYFRTKGDAVEEPDPTLVAASNVVGRVVFHIPYLGYVVTFAGTKMGIVSLVIVPAVLLGVSEVYDLVVAVRGGGEG
ncbi:MAG: signal peptidase I [Halanaeroarchaeum sp.]